MPTLTRLASWQPTETPRFDGQDVWPLLSGAVDKPAPRTIYIPLNYGAAVLDGDWKLIVYEKGKRERGKAEELFHITADPYEKNDLAAAEPDRVQALRAKLVELRRDDLKEPPADLKSIDHR